MALPTPMHTHADHAQTSQLKLHEFQQGWYLNPYIGKSFSFTGFHALPNAYVCTHISIFPIEIATCSGIETATCSGMSRK